MMMMITLIIVHILFNFSGLPFLCLQNEGLDPDAFHALSSSNIFSSERGRKIYFISSGQPRLCCSLQICYLFLLLCCILSWLWSLFFVNRVLFYRFQIYTVPGIHTSLSTPLLFSVSTIDLQCILLTWSYFISIQSFPAIWISCVCVCVYMHTHEYIHLGRHPSTPMQAVWG